MYGSWSQKKTPKKDLVEGAKQFIRECGWDMSFYRQGDKCGCRVNGKEGTLQVKWYGDYIGTDWHVQRKVSYRCSQCGKFVVFTDREPHEGEQYTGIDQQVIIP